MEGVSSVTVVIIVSIYFHYEKAFKIEDFLGNEKKLLINIKREEKEASIYGGYKVKRWQEEIITLNVQTVKD